VPGSNDIGRSSTNATQFLAGYIFSSLPGEPGFESSQSRPDDMSSRWRIVMARFRASRLRELAKSRMYSEIGSSTMRRPRSAAMPVSAEVKLLPVERKSWSVSRAYPLKYPSATSRP
jgi:hypothetical protein